MPRPGPYSRFPCPRRLRSALSSANAGFAILTRIISRLILWLIEIVEHFSAGNEATPT